MSIENSDTHRQKKKSGLKMIFHQVPDIFTRNEKKKIRTLRDKISFFNLFLICTIPR